MEILVWAGAAVSVIGILGIIWCVVRAMRAKRQDLSDEDMRATMQSIVMWNMAALFVSAIGLMMVVVGVMLA